MGVLETKRVIQPPKRRRMTKRKRTLIMCARIAGLSVAALAFIIIVYMVGFAEYTYINLSELTQATVSGYNGHGTLDTVTQPMAGLEDFFDTVSVTVLDTDEIKNGSLSNGNKIEIEYSYNKEMAKEKKLRVRGGSEFVTIKDLPDGKPITFDELFSGVKLEYEGVAPVVSVSVVNTSTDALLSDVVYSVADDKEFYDEGDIVRIKADFDQNKAVEEAYDIEAGPEGYVKEFTVTGVDRYLTDASELPQELLDQMKEYGATLFGAGQGDANEYGVRIFTSAGTMYSTSGGDYTFAWRTPSYISSYFTCINDESQGAEGNQINDVKIVYDTAVVQADGKSVSAEAVVSFKNLVKKADGSIVVDFESGEIVSASTNDSEIKALVRATGDELYTSTKLEQ